MKIHQLRRASSENPLNAECLFGKCNACSVTNSVAECRTVAIGIVPLCRVVTPPLCISIGITTVHSGAISIATVLHSATELNKSLNAQRCRSETETFIWEYLIFSVQYCHSFKNITTLET